MDDPRFDYEPPLGLAAIQFYEGAARGLRRMAGLEAAVHMPWLHRALQDRRTRGRAEALRDATAGLAAGYQNSHANGAAAIWGRS